MDSSVHFLQKIPKAGSYFACALQSDLGEYKAILGSDTLIPPGSAGSIEEVGLAWNSPNNKGESCATQNC